MIYGGPLSPCYDLRFADTMGHCHRVMTYGFLTRWSNVTVLWSTVCWHNGPQSPCSHPQFAGTVGHCLCATLLDSYRSGCSSEERTGDRRETRWEVRVREVETVLSSWSPGETSNWRRSCRFQRPRRNGNRYLTTKKILFYGGLIVATGCPSYRTPQHGSFIAETPHTCSKRQS